MIVTTAVMGATATQIALTEMWTENTGRHFLDSGGAYGRNWERNQGLDVEAMLAKPEVWMDLTFGLDITVSAWHWLDSFLEYDPYMQRVFERYSNLEGLKDEPWLVCAEALAEAAHEADRYADWPRVTTINTYNGESWLDSVLQYVMFTRDDQTYVLLQYHGGCDVRGGYTKPRVFKVLGEGFYEFYTEGHVSLHCTENHGQSLGEGLFGEVRAAVHAWSSNSSGVEWYDYEGSSYAKSDDFEVIEPEDGSDNYVACPTCKAPLEISVMFGH